MENKNIKHKLDNAPILSDVESISDVDFDLVTHRIDLDDLSSDSNIDVEEELTKIGPVCTQKGLSLALKKDDKSNHSCYSKVKTNSEKNRICEQKKKVRKCRKRYRSRSSEEGYKEINNMNKEEKQILKFYNTYQNTDYDYHKKKNCKNLNLRSKRPSRRLRSPSYTRARSRSYSRPRSRSCSKSRSSSCSRSRSPHCRRSRSPHCGRSRSPHCRRSRSPISRSSRKSCLENSRNSTSTQHKSSKCRKSKSSNYRSELILDSQHSRQLKCSDRKQGRECHLVNSTMKITIATRKSSANDTDSNSSSQDSLKKEIIEECRKLRQKRRNVLMKNCMITSRETLQTIERSVTVLKTPGSGDTNEELNEINTIGNKVLELPQILPPNYNDIPLPPDTGVPGQHAQICSPSQFCPRKISLPLPIIPLFHNNTSLNPVELPPIPSIGEDGVPLVRGPTGLPVHITITGDQIPYDMNGKRIPVGPNGHYLPLDPTGRLFPHIISPMNSAVPIYMSEDGVLRLSNFEPVPPHRLPINIDGSIVMMGPDGRPLFPCSNIPKLPVPQITKGKESEMEIFNKPSDPPPEINNEMKIQDIIPAQNEEVCQNKSEINDYNDSDMMLVSTESDSSLNKIEVLQNEPDVQNGESISSNKVTIIERIKKLLQMTTKSELNNLLLGRFIPTTSGSGGDSPQKSYVLHESPLLRNRVKLEEEKVEPAEETVPVTFKFTLETRRNLPCSCDSKRESSSTDLAVQCDFTSCIITGLESQIFKLKSEVNRLKNLSGRLLTENNSLMQQNNLLLKKHTTFKYNNKVKKLGKKAKSKNNSCT